MPTWLRLRNAATLTFTASTASQACYGEPGILTRRFLLKRALQHLGRNALPAYRIQCENAETRSLTEALEPRLFLSGSVSASVVGGRLVIRGDNAANAIVLDQAGLGAGQMRISGTGGTAINQQTGAMIVSGVTRGTSWQWETARTV